MSMVNNNEQRLVTVDFDGTCCEFAFPEIGAPKPGLKDALTAIRKMGYLILIYSCRTCHWHYKLFGGEGTPVLERPTVVAMREWLDFHEIPYDEIDDGSRGKPLASFMIDDKGVRYDNNWPEVVSFIFNQTCKGQ